jgi:hypothetical protein
MQQPHTGIKYTWTSDSWHQLCLFNWTFALCPEPNVQVPSMFCIACFQQLCSYEFAMFHGLNIAHKFSFAIAKSWLNFTHNYVWFQSQFHQRSQNYTISVVYTKLHKTIIIFFHVHAPHAIALHRRHNCHCHWIHYTSSGISISAITTADRSIQVPSCALPASLRPSCWSWACAGSPSRCPRTWLQWGGRGALLSSMNGGKIPQPR